MEGQTQTQVPAPNIPTQQSKPLTEEQLISVFSTGEKVERTPRGAKPQPQSQTQTTAPTNGKKKKGKK